MCCPCRSSPEALLAEPIPGLPGRGSPRQRRGGGGARLSVRGDEKPGPQGSPSHTSGVAHLTSAIPGGCSVIRCLIRPAACHSCSKPQRTQLWSARLGRGRRGRTESSRACPRPWKQREGPSRAGRTFGPLEFWTRATTAVTRRVLRCPAWRHRSDS